MAIATCDAELLAALAAGRLPAAVPAEGEASPALIALIQQFLDVQMLALSLGRGELTLPGEIRSRGPLVGSLKALHAALRHVSWQAQRVAEGDLSHQVDFMGDFATAFNEMVRQLAERQQLETQLRQSQKLEAVGRLASGLAHEINTPAQFVSDDIQFLSTSLDALLGLVTSYRETLAALGEAPLSPEIRTRLAATEEAADLAFLALQAPEAAKSAREGIARIAGIVAAMKEFASPDLRDKCSTDLNRALRATLIVAQAQYREVAAVETDFGEIPPLRCHPGELNEVFLILISNAVHAIEDSGRAGQGQIRIRTAADGEGARIDIADNGCGIPPAIAERVFDPFFTTKAVGRGSGQGLAVARSVIVEGHQGTLTFTTQADVGTTFSVWLPTG